MLARRLPLSFVHKMTKRALSPSSSPVSINKRPHFTSFRPNKIATRQNAAAVDADPPFNKLLSVLKGIVKDARKGDSVVYWMRMGDIRGGPVHSPSLVFIPDLHSSM